MPVSQLKVGHDFSSKLPKNSNMKIYIPEPECIPVLAKSCGSGPAPQRFSSSNTNVSMDKLTAVCQ
jgi:hypothetical protein